MLKSLLHSPTIKAGQRVMYRYSMPSGVVTGTVVFHVGDFVEVKLDDGREVLRLVKSWELMK